MELKTNYSKKRLLNLFLTVLIFSITAGFLFFGNVSNFKAQAFNVNCNCPNGATGYVIPMNIADPKNPTADETKKCNDDCIAAGYKNGTFKLGQAIKQGVQQSMGVATDISDPNNIVSKAFRWLLLGILSLVGMLLSAATTIFGWIIDVGNFKQVVDGPVIYEIWKQVRDILNIAFILVLLYSAFCTILQIEKYSYKKLLLNLVIMALLVNFSFPITRFIIDTSNVLMYTIASTLLGANAGNALGNISGNSGIWAILTPGGEAPISFLITAIIFGFILAITLLAVGILLVVRMIALALLIIFSPLAFVATILPDASNYSTKWWDNLFKYSFFGPIMLFVIYIASAIAGEMSKSTPDFVAIAQSNTISPQMIGFMAYFAMPIVLLWMGMGIAQSMSIAGAGAVMGAAQKFAKWVPKSIAHATGVPGGIKKAAEYYGKKGAPFGLNRIPGLRGSEATENTEAGIAGFLTKGAKGYKSAQENIQRKRIAAKQKEFEDERLSETEAKAKLKSSDNVEKKAAALYLSKKDKINDSATFALAMDALTGDEELQKELRGKAKKDNNIKLVLDYDLDRGIKIKDKTTGKETLTKDKATIYATTLAMSSDDLAKQKSLHDDIETNGELRDYIKTTENSYITKLFEKLTPAQQKSYIARGLNPETRTKSGTANNQKMNEKEAHETLREMNS
ncbi:MAG: hypothetical protein ABH835_00220 [Patescibacteria group bacterium]